MRAPASERATTRRAARRARPRQRFRNQSASRLGQGSLAADGEGGSANGGAIGGDSSTPSLTVRGAPGKLRTEALMLGTALLALILAAPTDLRLLGLVV